MNRSQDWLMQAERDLAQASASRSDERHEWACFDLDAVEARIIGCATGDEAYTIYVNVAPVMDPVNVTQEMGRMIAVIVRFHVGGANRRAVALGYRYNPTATIPGDGYTTFVVDLKSQSWRSLPEVDRTVWQHVDCHFNSAHRSRSYTVIV